MARQESRQATELQKLRAWLVKRLARLDFRSESLDAAFGKMTQQVERILQRLTP